MNFYEELGIPRDASADRIRRAYRERVKQVHPDVNPGRAEWANHQTRKLQEIYEVLSDPARRGRYDEGLAPRPRAPAGSAALTDNRVVQWAVGLAFLAVAFSALYRYYQERPRRVPRESYAAVPQEIPQERLDQAPKGRSINEVAREPMVSPDPAAAFESSARPSDTFTRGSTTAEVLAIQGPPMRIRGTTFYYRHSWVVFDGGQVQSWYESQPGELKVRD